MTDKVKIQIKYHGDIEPIGAIKIGDWIDLRAAENVFINEGEFALIPLGISMKLPEGYEAHIAPRSSTFKNYGIIQTNGIGVIDNSYSGTNDIWKMPVYCLKSNTDTFYGNEFVYEYEIKGTHIRKGDRICQFRIVKKQPDIEFEEVMFLDETDRGGFGSTGVK